MEEYLEKGGFCKIKINNYKNSFYLCNKFDDNNYVIYVKGNAIKHYMKKYYSCVMKNIPNEMFLMKYGDRTIIKTIDIINKSSQLKLIPYNKEVYEMQFQNIVNNTVEYAIKVSAGVMIKDLVMLNIFQSYGITIFYTNDDYHDKLDLWLDQI